jgi:hypothetical protein
VPASLRCALSRLVRICGSDAPLRVVALCFLRRSRPKNVGEVACQEEVVATLSKAIETANVRALCSRRSSAHPACSAAPACALPPHRRSSALAPRARRRSVTQIRHTAALRPRIALLC